MKFRLAILSFILLNYSCTVEPEKINYGEDTCHYCKMNIVNKLYGAEIVTKKGKNFKYDASECLLNDLKNRNSDKIGLFLVTDYSIPEKLIDATEASFVISDQIQSPMGGNLASFEDKSKALNFLQENEGAVYTWKEIQTQFEKHKQ